MRLWEGTYILVVSSIWVAGKAGGKEAEKGFLLLGLFGCLIAQLWLRSLKQLLPLNHCGCPGDRMVVARHRGPIDHPESSDDQL